MKRMTGSDLILARLGAQITGFSAEEVAALEKEFGYRRLMNMFREIGSATVKKRRDRQCKKRSKLQQERVKHRETK